MPNFIPVEKKKIPHIAVNNPQQTIISNIKNPFSKNAFKSPIVASPTPAPEIKIPAPGEGLSRIIHYCADQSGCAFWRMIWPGDELLANNKSVIMTLYQMVFNAAFYQGITAVRLQRQCTEHQKNFIEFLRKVSDEFKKQTGKGFKIIWEVDDLIGPYECLPKYNVCTKSFKDEKIMETVKQILPLCDEMVCVSEPMREHYKKHLGYDRISVIPNYMPKSWGDRGFDIERRMESYRNNKEKPCIVYAGSATHFDLENATNQMDDFAHVVDDIIRDIIGPKKFKWVFIGGLPMKLRQFMGRGVEFHNWCAITDYMELLKSVNAQVMIAPLADNVFSRCKADIKLSEGGALGIPVVAQNLDCYNKNNEWKWLFNTSSEMFDHIDNILKDEETYRNSVEISRQYAEKRWLKDHLEEWMLMYNTPYGDPERKKNESFYSNNRNQFV